LSGERRRQQQQQNESRQQQQQQQKQHESRQLPDTSLPPPPPPQTTVSTTARIVTTAPSSQHEKHTVQSSSSTTTTTTTELPSDDTTMSIHSQPERKQIGNISPSTTLFSSTTTTVLPFKQPSHSEIELKTTTAATTTRSSISHQHKENDPNHEFSVSTTTKITASTTTVTTTTTATSSTLFDSSTKKLVAINHPSNRENFEVTTGTNVRTAVASKTGGRPQNEEEIDHEFKEEKVESATADLATSTVRGEKALFTSFEMVKQQHRNTFETILNSTIGASITTTTLAATSRHTTTSRPTTTITTTTTTITTTTSPTTKLRLLTTTTAPQKIYLQEVEEITDIDEDELRNSTTVAAMESKALHSNVPPPRQLTSDDKAGVLQKTSQVNLETTEATKMVVEYLEEAELARSFPSTKWNVYEDQVFILLTHLEKLEFC